MSIKITENPIKKEPSSEEQFLMNFFDSEDYVYEFEKYRLNNLDGDLKNYRVPDFYLKKYKIYVEYYGLYNSTKETRSEYDLKSNLYIKNDIPTIFLYPHELGIIEYIFHVRILKLLKVKKFNLKPQLIRYKMLRFLKKTTSGNFLIFFLALLFEIGLIKIETGLKKDFVILVFVGIFFAMIWSLIMVFVDFWRYFIKEK